MTDFNARAETIRSRFVDHVASRHLLVAVPNDGLEVTAPAFERLVWRRRDGSSFDHVEYLLDKRGGTLYVSGDYGAATYRWGPYGPYTLEWIAELNLDYFESKCEASPSGRRHREWSEEEALFCLKDWRAETDEGAGLTEGQEADYAEALRCCTSRQEWLDYLGDEGGRVFGSDYYEFADIGEVVSWWCQSHLVGLQAAVAQLAEAEVAA